MYLKYVFATVPEVLAMAVGNNAVDCLGQGWDHPVQSITELQ